jgi:hypothetical protein
MASAPQFAPDGSRFYLTVRDFDSTGGGFGGGPMHQGDAPGAERLMSTSVVAVDRSGAVLWTRDLTDGGAKGGRAR